MNLRLRLTKDMFGNDGEWSALQAFCVIQFADSQPDVLGYSNEWTVSPKEYPDGLGCLKGWTFSREEDFELHVGHGR